MDGLPARYYLDQAVLDAERERIFQHEWLLIMHTSELPQPDSAVALRVLDIPILVARDAAGEVRCYHNVCRHRGCQLVADGEQARARITCPFHKWSYDLQGRLSAAPHVDGLVDGFSRADHALRPIRLELRWGFVAINFDPDAAPLERPEALDRVVTRYRLERMRVTSRRHYTVRANWKIAMENDSECIHCPVVHPQMNRVAPSATETEIELDGYSMLTYQELMPGFATFSAIGKSLRPAFSGLEAEDLHRCYFITLMPNVFLALFPDYCTIVRCWPVTPSHTEITIDWLCEAALAEQPGFDDSDAVEAWDLVYRQDVRIMELLQSGIASPGHRPGPYSPEECNVLLFDEYVAKKLSNKARRASVRRANTSQI